MTGKNVLTVAMMSQSKDTKRSASNVNAPENITRKSLDHHGVSCKSTARVTIN
jgi:hypothetical protein